MTRDEAKEGAWTVLAPAMTQRADDQPLPPLQLNLPHEYNAARHFIDRHLEEGRGKKAAYIDDQGSHTYAELASA